MSYDFMFPGEEIDFTKAESIRKGSTSDAELTNRYSAGVVRIVTEQARYPLPQIPQMVSSSDYRLDPEFQRRHRWDNVKKSRLIESFIINVPVPPVFLYEVGYAKYEVMDGLQRLTAISDFYEDRLELEGLEEWPELNGRSYSTLPEVIRRGVDRRYLSSVVLLRETASDPEEAQRLKQLVFERINSGGIKLSDQESRNAIFDGRMNRLCIRLSRQPALCHTWDIPPPDEIELSGGDISAAAREDETFSKMEDVELVLRFFAYRQRLRNQDGTLKEFLDLYLKSANKFPREVLGQLGHTFRETIDLADALFGESAFYLWRRRTTGWGWFRRPTLVVYDPMMFALSQFLPFREQLIDKKGELKDAIKYLYEHEYTQFQGRYTNRENLTTRNALFMRLFSHMVS